MRVRRTLLKSTALLIAFVMVFSSLPIRASEAQLPEYPYPQYGYELAADGETDYTEDPSYADDATHNNDESYGNDKDYNPDVTDNDCELDDENCEYDFYTNDDTDCEFNNNDTDYELDGDECDYDLYANDDTDYELDECDYGLYADDDADYELDNNECDYDLYADDETDYELDGDECDYGLYANDDADYELDGDECDYDLYADDDADYDGDECDYGLYADDDTDCELDGDECEYCIYPDCDDECEYCLDADDVAIGLGFGILPAYIGIVRFAGPGTPVSITSVEYCFTVDGVAAETSLEFNMTGAGWQGRTLSIPLVNGTHSVTATFGGVDGIINLGYLTYYPGSNITVVVDKIVINGNIELTFATAPILSPLTGQNNLPNIWGNPGANVIIASTANDSHWLAFDDIDDLLRVFEEDNNSGTTPLPLPPLSSDAVPVPFGINTVTYNFTVVGATGGAGFPVSLAAWQNETTDGQPIIIPAVDGPFSFTADIRWQHLGIQNLGYVPDTDPLPAGVMLILDSIVINGNIELTFVNAPVLSSSNRDLPNAFSAPDGLVIASNADDSIWLSFGYDGTNPLLRLFEEDDPDPGTSIATLMTSIAYHFTVTGATGGAGFVFNAGADQGEVLSIPDVNGVQTVTLYFDGAGNAGLQNLGFTDSPIGANTNLTLNSVTVNGNIVLIFDPPRVLHSGENGLHNIWNVNDGTVIA